MKVLLVGSGGREHEFAKVISSSYNEPELYAAMSKRNPGISKLCKGFKIISEDDCGIVDYAEKKKIELAVIGGETSLAASISDLLWDAGIPTVGPKKLAAQIETNKPWARESIMEKHHIPGNPQYCIFRKNENTAFDVGAYIDELISQDIDPVIKPAGLTGGKGVRLFPDHFDIGGAKKYAAEVLKKSDLVIEERLRGEEFTLQAFVDGDTLAFGPAVQDEKRAREKGPNTGGMGSYNDSKDILPFMTQADYDGA
ncbi:MAG: phosphoribosylamine--glycine ligase, partial [Nanoarchaeota archaeon]|nr:phosphoribosylamine--glycine ligase [Nanoarchaeota archaeon]